MKNVVYVDENQKRFPNFGTSWKNFDDQDFETFFNWIINVVLESLHRIFLYFSNELLIVLTYQIQHTLHEFLPVHKIKSKKEVKNWITKEIKRENTKEHKFYKFFLQNPTEAAKHLHQKLCTKKIIGKAVVF